MILFYISSISEFQENIGVRGSILNFKCWENCSGQSGTPRIMHPEGLSRVEGMTWSQ